MMCQRCLLLDRSALMVTKEGEALPSTNVGPAVTVLNGEALCLRHWKVATEPD